jgi:serralysin
LGNDIIEGGPGVDTICGGDGNDTIRGGLGNDTITDGTGSDVIFGDAGNDDINLTNDGERDRVFAGPGDDDDRLSLLVVPARTSSTVALAMMRVDLNGNTGITTGQLRDGG